MRTCHSTAPREDTVYNKSLRKTVNVISAVYAMLIEIYVAVSRHQRQWNDYVIGCCTSGLASQNPGESMWYSS